MNVLTDPFTPTTYPDLFTWMSVAGVVIALGAIFVYSMAQRRYRRYPEILALHEWVFWPIVVVWGVIPLLAVIGVPLILQLAPRADRHGHLRARRLRPLPGADRGRQRRAAPPQVRASAPAHRSVSAPGPLPQVAAASTADRRG